MPNVVLNPALPYEAADRTASPFWFPVAIITLVVLTVSAELGYAASGGAEVYGYEARVGSNLTRQVAFVVLGTMGAWLLLVCNCVRKLPAWQVMIPALTLLTYIFASTIWSDDPSTTIKRSVVVACVVFAGLGMGKVWDFRQFTTAILILCSTFLVLSVLAELRYRAFLGGFGDYRFSGIFHPAKQAFNCGMLALASLSLYFIDRRKLFLLIAAIAFVFLVLTKARTGLIATVVACGILVWPYLSLRMMILASVLGAWSVSLLLIYFGTTGRNLDMTSLATMGRDVERANPTELTGRLPIWNHALDLASQQPILGYGYGAFWSERRLNDFERRNGWPLAHSHSAYIESMVNMGAVGLLMGLCLALIAFVRSVRLSAYQSTSTARLIAALIVLAIVSGLTEVAFIKDGYEFLALTIGIGLLAFDSNLDGLTQRRRPEQAAFPHDRLSEAQP